MKRLGELAGPFTFGPLAVDGPAEKTPTAASAERC
jgi:hypothetical protein